MAMFVLVVDTSLMNVSISAVVHDLDTTASGVQSAIALEPLVSAAFILIGSKIADLIGRKRAYIIGLLGYAAGALSMGNLADYGYVGVFSSGLLFRNVADWEKQNTAILDDAKLKDGRKLMWFATGSQDFLIQGSRQTVDLFKRHGFNPVFKESAGGHTWVNWREYLNEFAPQLFR
jgi:MFS family permease